MKWPSRDVRINNWTCSWGSSSANRSWKGWRSVEFCPVNRRKTDAHDLKVKVSEARHRWTGGMQNSSWRKMEIFLLARQTVVWWLLLITTETSDDNSIIPVSRLHTFFPEPTPPPTLPFFLSLFIDERLPLFSVNGPQSSELNIDFIRSLVTWSVTTRCLLQKTERQNGREKKNTRMCPMVEERRRERREGWRRWEIRREGKKRGGGGGRVPAGRH